ncbi:MAG: hypothetical protein ACRDY7_13090 [Acidimicrobiia bacterium]
MLETMHVTMESSLPAAELVAFCQSAEARRCWPGVTKVESQEGGYVYSINVDAPGWPSGELVVEEHIRPPEKQDDAVSLEAGLLWSWPSGQSSSSWMSYRFVEELDRTRVHYSLRYVVPGGALGRLINRGRFVRTMERGVRRYLACLTKTPEPVD